MLSSLILFNLEFTFRKYKKKSFQNLENTHKQNSFAYVFGNGNELHTNYIPITYNLHTNYIPFPLIDFHILRKLPGMLHTFIIILTSNLKLYLSKKKMHYFIFTEDNL